MQLWADVGARVLQWQLEGEGGARVYRGQGGLPDAQLQCQRFLNALAAAAGWWQGPVRRLVGKAAKALRCLVKCVRA